jgi:hypothetical protein
MAAASFADGAPQALALKPMAVLWATRYSQVRCEASPRNIGSAVQSARATS